MLLNDEEELQKRSTIYHQVIRVDDENDSKAICYNYVEADKKVLDVGCACGDLGVVLHKLKNCIVYGMEYNVGSIKEAEDTKAYEKIYQVDLNNFKPSEFPELLGKFDYIIFGDVLEHLADPKGVLTKFKKLLAKDGKIVISLPNVSHASVRAGLLLNNFEYTDWGVLDKTHVSFYTSCSISTFCAETGLKIDVIKPTWFDPKGRSTSNLFFQLPFRISKFILNDYHSWVWQYVLLLTVSDSDEKELIRNNEEKFGRLDDLCLYKDRSKKYLWQLYNRKFINKSFWGVKLFFFEKVLKSKKKSQKIRKKLEQLRCL